MGDTIQEYLTYDDVLIKPQKLTFSYDEISIATRLTRRINIAIPIISAAMDTVTEGNMAIAIAQIGGIGMIHKSLSIKKQVAEVDKVKRYEAGMISEPLTLPPDADVAEALTMMQTYNIGGIPIVDNEKLVGILTNRDLRFEPNHNRKVSDLMTVKLITVPLGTTLDDAKAILQKHRIEKLPVVDNNNRLTGLITVKDIDKRTKHPYASKDGQGRLQCGASIGCEKEDIERAQALAEAGVDVITIDKAHGHQIKVIEIIKYCKKHFPNVDIIAGNVVTHEGTTELIAAGADAVKVGIGPGSICTTRIVAGAGMPQVSAIMGCAQAARKHNIPIIADGGIKYSGDIVKGLAAGADTVMLGGMLAGCAESPGEIIYYKGRSFKVYRGMGSIGAMVAGGRTRYFQTDEDDEQRLVPEGIEGRVPYKGKLAAVLHQMAGGIRSGMSYAGCKTIHELQTKTELIKITTASLRESHPHDITIVKEAPNYFVE